MTDEEQLDGLFQDEETVEQQKNNELEKYRDEDETDNETPRIDKYYSNLRNFVRLVASDRVKQQALMLNADPGLGKTFQIKKTLANYTDPEDVVYNSGYLTPLELYKLMYKNRDKIVVLDDIEGLANNKTAVSIMKAAVDTEGEKNFVQWNSSTSRLDSVPSEFAFEGKLIMCFNEVPDLDKNRDVKALKGRTIYYEIELDYAERLDVIYELSKVHEYEGLTEDERYEVVKWIATNTTPATEDLNLRTLFRCYDKYIYAKDREGVDWTDLAEDVINKDEYIAKVAELLNDPYYGDGNLSEAASEYSDEMARSKRDFWRKKKELEERKGDYREVTERIVRRE